MLTPEISSEKDEIAQLRHQLQNATEQRVSAFGIHPSLKNNSNNQTDSKTAAKV